MKILSTILIFSLLMWSCSSKMTGVLSRSEEKKTPGSRKVIDVNNYRIADQEKFDIRLHRNETVEYSTTYEELQKWHNPNIYTTYPILGFGFGYLTYLIIDTDPSAWGVDPETGQPDNSKKIASGVLYGLVSISSFIAMFYGKANYTKNATKPGRKITEHEWVTASHEPFIASYSASSQSYTTNSSGILKVNPYDFKFPVLTKNQNLPISLSKANMQKVIAKTDIHSSWWMKTYGVINEDPVYIQGALSPPTRFPGHALLGAGSTVFQKEQDLLMLKINNNNAWLQPSSLNLFFYSSSLDLGEIPALKSIDYKLKDWAIIKLQKRLIESEINK
jgi:hypothetical protein